MDIRPPDSDGMKGQAHLWQYAEVGRKHIPVRLGSDTKFLTELIGLLGLHGQNWTSRFGRAFQYEFYIQEKDPEISLLVEISAIVGVAFVYYGYRVHHPDGSFEDHCSDTPGDSGHSDYRKRAVRFLVDRGYEVLPHEARSYRFGDKSLCELLIYDPED